jgi:hypothetical protein
MANLERQVHLARMALVPQPPAHVAQQANQAVMAKMAWGSLAPAWTAAWWIHVVTFLLA